MDQVLGFVGVGRMGGPMAIAAARCGPFVVRVRYERGGGEAAGGAGREVGRVRRRRGVGGGHRPDQPAHAAHRAGREPGRQGILQGIDGQDADRSVDDGPSVAGIVAKAASERGVAWVDSPVSGGIAGATKGTLAVMVSCTKDTFPDRRSGAQDVRQDVLRWREAGPCADRQAGEQPAGRRGDRGVVRGDGDGRESRTRRQDAHRHHQRRQRTQQRDAGQVPASRSSRARSISASRRACRTRTCACVVDEAEALGVPMVAGAAVRQMLAITQAKFGADSDFTSIARVVEEWAGVEIK